MWRIIQILGKFGNLLLFLALELIALLIVVTVNKPQREVSQGIFLEMSGSFSSVGASVGGYFNLASENEKLKGQNAELLAELQGVRDSMQTLRYRSPHKFDFQQLPDSLRNDSLFMDSLRIAVDMPDSLFPADGYRFLPARVINNSVHLNYNYITINRGSRHGVEVGMGLISPEGVAGQVSGVSKNYAIALSQLNQNFRLSAKLVTNTNVGTMTWDGANPEIGILEYIPQTSQIKLGDTVVTSGFSTIFPPNYFVGTVESFNSDAQDGFFHIQVRLATQYRALDNVFVVTHRYRAEIDSLQSVNPQE